MSLKKFLLYVFAFFLLLMLNFAAVYGYIAITSTGGFPIVGSESGAVAIGLLALDLLLWWYVSYRRNRQAYELPAAAPARQDMSPDGTVPTLIRPSWHPNAGNTVRDIRPKQVLAPLAIVLSFVLGVVGVIYLIFHFGVFHFGYSGDPAVFGKEYQNAKVVMSTYDRQSNQGVFVLEMESGEQRILAFDGSDFHPGRYRYPARELGSVPRTGGFVTYTLYRNFWAWLELALVLLFAPAALAVSLHVSRRIRPKEAAADAA